MDKSWNTVCNSYLEINLWFSLRSILLSQRCRQRLVAAGRPRRRQRLDGNAETKWRTIGMNHCLRADEKRLWQAQFHWVARPKNKLSECDYIPSKISGASVHISPFRWPAWLMHTHMYAGCGSWCERNAYYIMRTWAKSKIRLIKHFITLFKYSSIPVSNHKFAPASKHTTHTFARTYGPAHARTGFCMAHTHTHTE